MSEGDSESKSSAAVRVIIRTILERIFRLKPPSNSESDDVEVRSGAVTTEAEALSELRLIYASLRVHTHDSTSPLGKVKLRGRS